MKTFEINAIVGDREKTFTIQEEASAGLYLVTCNQKFITRIWKDADGRWKTKEVSDLNPSDINTLGEEIELYLNK